METHDLERLAERSMLAFAILIAISPLVILYLLWQHWKD